MNNVKKSKVWGLILGILLLPFAYFSFWIGFILAFAKYDWFMYTSFVYAFLGITCIVCACITKKHPLPLKITSSIITLLLLCCFIFLLITSLFFNTIWVLVIYFAMLLLGFITTINSYKAKKSIVQENNIELSE